MVRRITFILAAFMIVVAAYPAAAQQAEKIPLVGFLGGTAANEAVRFNAFREKMRELGYVEGRTIRFASRYADGNRDRLAGLAAELVQLKPDVIVTNGTPATRAARKASGKIPIVMHGRNPAQSGLVASLARPGGNITGLTPFPESGKFYSKRLQILKEAVPSATRIGILHPLNNNWRRVNIKAVEAAASGMGVTIIPLGVRNPEDVENALAMMKQQRVEAFLRSGSSVLVSRRKLIIAFALKHRLPYMSTNEKSVRAGALMSYAVNYQELYRHKAIYVDKILKGANPAEMPIANPTKFDLVVNLKSAKAFGITIPKSILLQATKVIE